MPARIDRSGFTLIELMIVIAIIGVLVAIAISRFISFRQKSYNSAAISDLRNAKTHLEVYYKENQCYP